MTTKIFVWNGNPRTDSLCGALADAYVKGAESKGALVRRMDLGEMNFGSDFRGYTPDMPMLEPDLLAWQDAIVWADHVVFVHPYWWGGMPAGMKMVLDRSLLSGFAYKYHARGVKWDKLLSGKTGDVIITSDTPPLIDTLLYWKPGRRLIKNQVFGFCGIKTRKAVQFGSVKVSTPEQRAAWLTKAARMGASAASLPAAPASSAHSDPASAFAA